MDREAFEAASFDVQVKQSRAYWDTAVRTPYKRPGFVDNLRRALESGVYPTHRFAKRRLKKWVDLYSISDDGDLVLRTWVPRPENVGLDGATNE